MVAAGRFILDDNHSIRNKYETAAYVLWNIPAIFIYHEDPRLELHDSLRSYWDAHVTTVDIEEDLYVTM